MELVRPRVPVNGEDTPSIMSNVFMGGTVIDIAWTQIHGRGPRYSYGKLIRDKITGWTSEKAFLRWELDVEQAGTYDVILQYGCDPKDAGSRIRITAAGDAVEDVVPSTGALAAMPGYKKPRGLYGPSRRALQAHRHLREHRHRTRRCHGRYLRPLLPQMLA